MDNLQQKYEVIANHYVQKFCEITSLEFDYWVADRIGEVAYIDSYFFDFNDIKYFVDNSIAFDWLQHWYDYNLNNYEKNINKHIEFDSYCSLRRSEDPMSDNDFNKYLDDDIKDKNSPCYFIPLKSGYKTDCGCVFDLKEPKNYKNFNHCPNCGKKLIVVLDSKYKEVK